MEKLYSAIAGAIVMGLGAMVVFMVLTVFISNYWPWMLALAVVLLGLKFVVTYKRYW